MYIWEVLPEGGPLPRKLTLGPRETYTSSSIGWKWNWKYSPSKRKVKEKQSLHDHGKNKVVNHPVLKSFVAVDFLIFLRSKSSGRPALYRCVDKMQEPWVGWVQRVGEYLKTKGECGSGRMGEGANQRWTLLSLVTRERGGVARWGGGEPEEGAMWVPRTSDPPGGSIWPWEPMWNFGLVFTSNRTSGNSG